MAHDNDLNWMIDIPVSTMLLAAWGSYFYWTSLSPDLEKTPDRLRLGYSYVFVALALITALLISLKTCWIALAIVLGPFGLICLAAVRTLQYIRFLLSFRVVSNARSFRGSDISRECCRLCERCQSIIKRSPLLIGARWLFTRSNERHAFYTKEELEKSAKDCHLCILLLKSVEEFRELTEKHTDTTNSELILLIQERKPVKDVAKLELELSGHAISKARRLRVNRNGRGISKY
jgi:hypothetical protein